VYGGYLFEYYQSSDPVATHAGPQKYRSSGSCRIHKWLAQATLQLEANLAYPTTTCMCSSRWIFGSVPSQQDALVHNRGAHEIGDVPKEIVFIWNYPGSIIFQRCAHDLQSHYHCGARDRVERGVFVEPLLIEIFRCWSCPVHTSDVDLSKPWCAGQMFEPVDSHVLTKKDAMHSIVLSTCDACCSIQLFSHILSRLQVPADELSSFLDQGYKSDRAAGGL
jgi:hypothetical protein